MQANIKIRSPDKRMSKAGKERGKVGKVLQLAAT